MNDAFCVELLERENYLLSVSKNDGILWRGILEDRLFYSKGIKRVGKAGAFYLERN